MKDLSKYGALDENVQGAEYENPEAGGYVCSFNSVKDVKDKEYLLMELDIAEGKFAGYYKSLEERADFWGLRNYASYKEASVPMFKKMCAAFNHSNPGIVFNPFDKKAEHDEQILKTGVIGVCLGETEYEKKDGSIGTKLEVRYFCNAKKVRDGKVKAPKKKTIEKPDYSNSDFMNIPASTSEEVPFD